MNRTNRLKPALLACAAGVTLLASPALAQTVDPNKLLELMVAKGLVSRAEADAMIAEATTAPAKPPVPAGGVANGVQTIPYVPQVVRDQIKAELKAELGTQAQAQGWAEPGQTPEWTRRLTLYGDLRVRGEGVFMDDGNADIFEDFGAINAGAGQNINDKTPGYVGPPYLNTREDRQRARIRARLGLKARIDDWISAEVRLATGNDSSPVSTNQTLGGGAGFGKYEIWLDRAALRLTPVEGVAVDVGRFANPFWTSELLFDDDLNFDGVAFSLNQKVRSDLTVFGTVGAFPIFNTNFNFGSRNAPEGKGGPYASKDKYLLASQLGVEWTPRDDLRLRLAAGYFNFEGVQGEVSKPCQFYEVVCSTDPTRPQFQQFGNTMFPIRNVVPNPNDPIGSPENQYFGLASPYEIVNVRGSADFAAFNGWKVRFEADYVKNLGVDESVMRARAVNNLGPTQRIPDPKNTNGTILVPGKWDGGSQGWSTRLTVGDIDLVERGDWNLSFGYRYLESDAVLDAFTDSDFHLGGTNSQGWTVGGAYAFGRNTSIGFRWLSAEEIADAPLSVDKLLIDLQTRF
ncbi:putative porin [Caulobacter mirabilis]|uniref:Porin n=1 Tax=Caulobacter mirabilis TaxID=69666 RepID=A0A2D2B2S2_9CAUL|nr:putative porin [Caulobacter mirabilis]ATQ44565.1 hypothetical protein CSW64_20315 [Caulobacter mirabilis]